MQKVRTYFPQQEVKKCNQNVVRILNFNFFLKKCFSETWKKTEDRAEEISSSGTKSGRRVEKHRAVRFCFTYPMLSMGRRVSSRCPSMNFTLCSARLECRAEAQRGAWFPGPQAGASCKVSWPRATGEGPPGEEPRKAAPQSESEWINPFWIAFRLRLLGVQILAPIHILGMNLVQSPPLQMTTGLFESMSDMLGRRNLGGRWKYTSYFTKLL